MSGESPITAWKVLQKWLVELKPTSKAAYPVEVFDDFDKMLEAVKPDGVIVTTKDAAHSDYIVKALDFGCDVVSEKPITTDEVKMKAIYEAEKRSGKRVQVTFNCRFMPLYMRVKELLNGGIIGTPLSVHYEWLLDTEHGADYFRRWHRERKNSTPTARMLTDICPWRSFYVSPH